MRLPFFRRMVQDDGLLIVEAKDPNVKVLNTEEANSHPAVRVMRIHDTAERILSDLYQSPDGVRKIVFAEISRREAMKK